MKEPLDVHALRETNPMQRRINNSLLSAWIRADLVNRAWADESSALILYDESKTFVSALPPVLGPVPSAGLTEKLLEVGIRHYSTGIV